MKRGNIRLAETTGEEEDGVDWRLRGERFELGEGEVARGDAYH